MTHYLTDRLVRTSIKEFFMDRSIGSSRRPSGALPARRFSMWSIILSTKYFLARSIFSPFLAEPEGEYCVNSVTNIKSSVSSSVIPRSAEKKFQSDFTRSCSGPYSPLCALCTEQAVVHLPIFCISCMRLSIKGTSFVARMKSSRRSQMPFSPFKNSPSL